MTIFSSHLINMGNVWARFACFTLQIVLNALPPGSLPWCTPAASLLATHPWAQNPHSTESPPVSSTCHSPLHLPSLGMWRTWKHGFYLVGSRVPRRHTIPCVSEVPNWMTEVEKWGSGSWNVLPKWQDYQRHESKGFDYPIPADTPNT